MFKHTWFSLSLSLRVEGTLDLTLSQRVEGTLTRTLSCNRVKHTHSHSLHNAEGTLTHTH